MADRDFYIKEGLVANGTLIYAPGGQPNVGINTADLSKGTFRVNGSIYVDTTVLAVGNINTAANVYGNNWGLFLNGLSVGNATSNVTINTTAFTGTAYFANQATSATQAANSTLLNNQNGAYYLNATNFNAGTLANTRLPFHMDQHVASDASPRFSSLGIGTAAGAAGTIQATGDITGFVSDQRLKTLIGFIENPLASVCALRGVRYRFNDVAQGYGYDPNERHVGLFAQEVQGILPEAVKLAPFDDDGSGKSKSGENYLTIQYEKIVPLLVEAIKELREEVLRLREDRR